MAYKSVGSRIKTAQKMIVSAVVFGIVVKSRGHKMICDKIKNIGDYLGINKNLDTAIEFILGNDLKSLPLGKTIIDGDSVFVNVISVKAEDKSKAEFEYHKDYFDVQIDIEGNEKIDFSFEAQETENYNYDCGFSVGETDISVVLGNKNFVICLPNEHHRPGASADKNDYLRKAIFKVKE